MNEFIMWLVSLAGWQIFLIVYSCLTTTVFFIFGWIIIRVFYLDINLNECNNDNRGKNNATTSI